MQSSRKLSATLGRGLAGASALAAGSQAYASIQTGTIAADALAPATLGGVPTGVNWDVDANGTTDFVFSYRRPNNTNFPYQANMNTTRDGTPGTVYLSGVVGTAATYNYGSKLASGTPINAGSGYVFGGTTGQPTGTQVILASRFGGIDYGGFATPGATGSSRGFVGFQFTRAGNTHYGWADIEVFGTATVPGGVGIRMYGSAFENTPGATINAGAIPEPTGLAVLALGAVAALRRRNA